jgi:hypothetical protein
MTVSTYGKLISISSRNHSPTMYRQLLSNLYHTQCDLSISPTQQRKRTPRTARIIIPYRDARRQHRHTVRSSPTCGPRMGESLSWICALVGPHSFHGIVSIAPAMPPCAWALMNSNIARHRTVRSTVGEITRCSVDVYHHVDDEVPKHKE